MAKSVIARNEVTKQSRSSRKKIAMVQGPPVRTEDLPIFTDPFLEVLLSKTLKALKNDRAYTVLEYHQTWALVHFEGAFEPQPITYH